MVYRWCYDTCRRTTNSSLFVRDEHKTKKTGGLMMKRVGTFTIFGALIGYSVRKTPSRTAAFILCK